MKIKFEIQPPIMPNFVMFKQEEALKQDGFKVGEGFAIADFTIEQAEEFADLMRSEFLKHWERKQKMKR